MRLKHVPRQRLSGIGMCWLCDVVNARSATDEPRLVDCLILYQKSERIKPGPLKQSISVSREQVERFRRVMGHSNNRPLQMINARPVLQ